MDLLEYKKEDLNKLSTEELKKLLDECKTQENKYHAMEMTKKILINSLYGALANKGFSLFNELIAQSITGNGRFFIQLGAKNIENKLQEILKSDKPYVTYGDTDSVYYQIEPIMEKIIEKNPNKTINEYVDLAAKFEENVVDPVIQNSISELSEKMNSYDKSSIGAKREIIADSCMFVAKKKYIARVRDAEGVRYPENDPHMKVMGLDLARSATPNWCRKKLEESLNVILDKSEEELKEWIGKIKNDFLKAPISDICMFGNVSRVDYFLETDKGIPWMCKAGIIYNRYIERNKLGGKYVSITNNTPVKLLCLLEPNPFGSDRIAYITDNFETEVKEYIDFDEQFKKGFMDPLNNMVKAINYNIYNTTADLEDW
jgi:hypothetical protein